MKVLHVIASVDRRLGGPVEGIFASAAVWREHGHDRHIVSLDPPDSRWVRESPVPTVALGAKGAFWRKIPFARYAFSPRLSAWILRNARNYDAVIVNGLWNYASFGSWRALHRVETPYFVFVHGMLDPWFNSAYPLKTLFKRLYWRVFEHRVLRDARGVMFTCEEEKRLAPGSFSPYRAREFVVGYGARDPAGDAAVQRAAFFAAAPRLAGRRFLLFLGRIHEKKGVDLLLDSFAGCAADFPDADLVIAGPDESPLAHSLKQRAVALGLADRVHWLGMTTGDVKWGAFAAAEAFVLPSHQENFGVAVAEALAKGKPVLITNKVNIWREIEADGAGLVVNDDLKGVAGGLREMLSMPTEGRRAMGEAARLCFERRYDLRNNAMSLLELIGSLLDRPHKAAEKTLVS